MKKITLFHIEHIVFSLAQKHLSFEEPIPHFGTRFPHILESCLAAPFQSFGGKDLYPTLMAKGGALFYLIIKNHPFQNGNKRMAMTTLLVFLYNNGQWIRVDTQTLYNFAVWVAQSPPEAKDEMLRYIEKFLKKYKVPLKESVK